MCFRKLFSSMSSSNQKPSETDEPMRPDFLTNNGTDSTSLLEETPLTEVRDNGDGIDSFTKEEMSSTEVLNNGEEGLNSSPNHEKEASTETPQPINEPNGESARVDSTTDSASESCPNVKDSLSEASVEDEDSAASQIAHEASDTTTPKENKPIEETSVPNPTCYKNYYYSLAELIGQDEVVSIVVSDDSGDLVYDKSAKALVGKPLDARDYWLEIELGSRVLRINCHINYNSRLLWNDIPSDQIVKSDKDYNAILTPSLEMVAVSHRGRPHANIGAYRDDDFYIGKVGKFTLSIVADGAGSSPRSSTGSKVFCREAGAHFAKLVEAKQEELLVMLNDMQHHPENSRRDQKFMSTFYEIFPATALYGRKVLTKMAEDNQIPLRHYHTTALFSMTVEIAQDSYFCAVFQIGDGVTMALTSQQFEQLGEGDSGDHPSETRFVTSNGVFDDAKALLNRIRFFFCKEKPTVISMTDGVSESYFLLPVGTLASDTLNIENDIKLNSYPQLDNFDLWKQFLSEVKDAHGSLKPAAEICDWLNYYIDGEHDDRTVSIVMYK